MTSVKTMLSTEGWGWKISTEKQLIAKFLGSIRKKISQNFNYFMAHREQLSYPAITVSVGSCLQAITLFLARAD